MKTEKADLNELPEYIKDYRDQSWQIEILIAGGVVFSLYSITDYFRTFFFETWSIVDYSTIQVILLFFAYLITRILLFGFIANLVFRAVWLAYLGINFSFPKGIRYEKLNTSDHRKEVMQIKSNIVQRVINLEKLCNLTYSMAILLALFSTSVMITMAAIIWIIEFFGFYYLSYSSVFIYGLAFVIATINSGLWDSLLFRNTKNSKLLNIKENVSRVLDYLTLSFLFKREFLVIKTNTRKWLLYAFTFIISIISLLVSVNQLGKYYPYGTFKVKFMDDREFYDLPYAPKQNNAPYDSNVTDIGVVFKGSIQSDIVKDRYLKLFLVSWHRFDKFLSSKLKELNYPIDLSVMTEADRRAIDVIEVDSIFNETVNALFTVQLDQDTLQDLRWRNYTHPMTNEQGYITFINIDSLKNAEHLLEIDVSWINSSGETVSAGWLDIPFWK